VPGNQLKGTVKSLKTGAVMAEVVVDAAGTSSLTRRTRGRSWPDVGVDGPENLTSFADLGQDAISTGAQGFEPPLQIPTR
jgi:hypothetical protein